MYINIISISYVYQYHIHSDSVRLLSNLLTVKKLRHRLKGNKRRRGNENLKHYRKMRKNRINIHKKNICKVRS